MGTEKSIVLFESADGSVELPVMLDPKREDVWLSRTQLATLFGRDVKTIGKHVANALRVQGPRIELSQNLRQLPATARHTRRSTTTSTWSSPSAIA